MQLLGYDIDINVLLIFNQTNFIYFDIRKATKRLAKILNIANALDLAHNEMTYFSDRIQIVTARFFIPLTSVPTDNQW